MDLIVIGFNFKTSSLATREAWAIAPNLIEAFLQNMKQRDGVKGVVLLSTCNRVELYAVLNEGISPALLGDAWKQFLKKEEAFKPGYIHSNEKAFLHLVKVAGGLDSMVLGETEIFGQVKTAYETALKEKTVCSLLNFVFQRAFQIAKKVRTETGISRYPVSVSSVAMMLLSQVFGEFKNVNALVVGLGEMGRQTATALSKKGLKTLTVINRTESKARDFAEQFKGGAFFAPWGNLAQAAESADVLVTCTSATDFVFSKNLSLQTGRFKVLIDLGVPRDIDPALGEGENVFLYNVDDLKGIADKNLTSRKREAEMAMGMLEKEIARFLENGKWEMENGGKILVPPKFSGV